jgi:putative two-component system response regulator
MLERQGMASTAVSTIAAARAQLTARSFDLVVTEVCLPDGTGAELTEYLRRRAPQIAAILVNGQAGGMVPSDALADRVDDYVARPFTSEQFAIAVSRAIRRKAERGAALAKSRADLAEDVLECLIRAGRFRDEETAEHVERVSRSCALIARSLGWSAADCATLRMASAMHDIGKVGVPDAVLRKPGKLTASERTRMERHARIGREILSGSRDPVLHMAATIAGSHHERMDGKGYPDHLAGEDIPLVGRITAVADVFDALTHDRVYRPALTSEAALDIMQAGDGTQFDPHIFAAFREVLLQVEQVSALYADTHAPELEPSDDEVVELPLRVLIIEDHGAVARGLALLLRREGMEVAGTAATLAEAEHLVDTHAADVAILDATLHGQSALGLIPKARARGMKVLLYTGGTLGDADQADGVASKSGGPAELIHAVREVAAGRSPTDRRVLGRAGRGLLTAREREIVAFLAQGVSGDNIAGLLFLSVHTVRTHIRNAMAKTKATTHAHLVALATETGEISP